MKRSRYTVIPIIILAIFYFSLGCSASEYQDNKPIVLKIDEYFIIYTYPVAPYISKQNKVMLPLETFCELIGAKYSFDKKSKLYLISFSNHKAKFKANSNMAWIDGKYVNIGSTTNIFKGSLVVPVGNLLKYFKINSRWDSKTHLLTLNDNRILKPSVIGDFEKTRASILDMLPL